MLQTPNTTTIIAAIGRMMISSQCWAAAPCVTRSKLTSRLAVNSKLLQKGPAAAFNWNAIAASVAIIAALTHFFVICNPQGINLSSGFSVGSPDGDPTPPIPDRL
jgi:hypothetical protein